MQTDKLISGRTNIQKRVETATNRELSMKDRQTKRHAGMQTDRQTDRQDRTDDSQNDRLLTMDNKQKTVSGQQTDRQTV